MTNGNKYITFKCADEKNCVAYVSAWQIEKLTPYIKTGTIESNMIKLEELISKLVFLKLQIVNKRGRDSSISTYFNVIGCI